MLYSTVSIIRNADPSVRAVLGSVSQPLRDRGPIKSFLIRRGPGPNKFTRKYL